MKLREAINHARLNISGGLFKPPFQLGYGRVSYNMTVWILEGSDIHFP